MCILRVVAMAKHLLYTCSGHWIESDQLRVNEQHRHHQQHRANRQQSGNEEDSIEEVITTTTETRQSLEYHPVLLTHDKDAYYIPDPFVAHRL